MITEVYVVTMEGVYRHNIMGVFQELEFAKNVAINAIKEEKDDYHCFEVREFDVGVPTNLDGRLKFVVKRTDRRGESDYVLSFMDEKDLAEKEAERRRNWEKLLTKVT